MPLGRYGLRFSTCKNFKRGEAGHDLQKVYTVISPARDENKFRTRGDAPLVD